MKDGQCRTRTISIEGDRSRRWGGTVHVKDDLGNDLRFWNLSKPRAKDAYKAYMALIGVSVKKVRIVEAP